MSFNTCREYAKAWRIYDRAFSHVPVPGMHTQTLATAEMELGAAEALVEEKTSLALESLHEEQKAVEALGALEVGALWRDEVLLFDVYVFQQCMLLVTTMHYR